MYFPVSFLFLSFSLCHSISLFALSYLLPLYSFLHFIRFISLHLISRTTPAVPLLSSLHHLLFHFPCRALLLLLLIFIPLLSLPPFFPVVGHRMGAVTHFGTLGRHGQLVFFTAGHSSCKAVDKTWQVNQSVSQSVNLADI